MTHAALYLCLATLAGNVVLSAWLIGAIRRVRVLDMLLQQVCVEAFARHHQPIWQAWTATMGSIVVEVSASRKGWGE